MVTVIKKIYRKYWLNKKNKYKCRYTKFCDPSKLFDQCQLKQSIYDNMCIKYDKINSPVRNQIFVYNRK